jgi:hypothetical protein
MRWTGNRFVIPETKKEGGSFPEGGCLQFQFAFGTDFRASERQRLCNLQVHLSFSLIKISSNFHAINRMCFQAWD